MIHKEIDNRVGAKGRVEVLQADEGKEVKAEGLVCTMLGKQGSIP